MIYEFTVENFRSFGAAQTLSLVKGRERNKPENLTIGPDGFPRALRVAAIFGHNASGKSNLLKAAEVFVNIVRSSAAVIYPNNLIPDVTPHRLAAEWIKKPSRFEIVFPTATRVFRYAFSAYGNRIADESLVEEMSSGRKVPIFTRHTDGAGKTAVDFHRQQEFEPVAQEQISKLTREASLVLSSGANLNVPLLREIFGLITERSLFLHFGPSPFDAGAQLARLLNDDANLTQQLQVFLRDADFGIKELRVPKPTPSEAWVTALLAGQPGPTQSSNAEQAARRYAEATARRPVQSLHKTADGRDVEFDWGEESDGTKRFAELFCFLSLAARNGWTVVIDEFGAHIHPLLAERLLEWFQNPQHHPAAQLIFTTHDTRLMGSNLLRKDQIWLTEKTLAGESQLACLADFRGKNAPRSTEAFERNYLAGVYGAIANFGPHLSGVGYGDRNIGAADAPPTATAVRKP